MTIVKKEKKNGIMIYVVKADLTDEQTEQMNGKLCTNRTFKDIIDHDADAYTEDGQLLLRFRKKSLQLKHAEDFYDNVIDFANHTTGARGACSASDVKDISVNKRIKSNIYGYFDKWTIFQKHMFKILKIKPPFPVRVTRFTGEFPEKWNKMIPLIQDVDKMYKKLVPKPYKFQKKCADETAYRIADTAFTTITTNVSTVMGCHCDTGNLKESFGNLVVIEKGKYEGCYTGFPQYKVAVDVRMGDFLAMNIHKMHGNTPLKLKSKDAERLSVVCYLRQGVWEKSLGSTKEHVEKNKTTMKKLLAKYNEVIHKK